MTTSYKRLTVEEVASLLTRHNFGLVFNTYGLHLNPRSEYHNCGCAVSVAILRHTDNPDAARKLFEDANNVEDVSRLVFLGQTLGLPARYLMGLLNGFDGNQNGVEYPIDYKDDEASKGYEDGKAIAKFALKQQGKDNA
jgi:hypothetical protein